MLLFFAKILSNIMFKQLRAIKTEFKGQPREYLIAAVKFMVGFLLSPLTWWNDIFVNVPLAWAFAYLVGRIIKLITTVNLFVFTILFLLGYIITNVLGIFLMGSGVKQVTRTKPRVLLAGIVAGVIYSIVVVLLGHSELAQELSLVPSWVRR